MVSLRTALAAILLVVVIDSARPTQGIAKTGTSTPQNKRAGSSAQCRFSAAPGCSARSRGFSRDGQEWKSGTRTSKEDFILQGRQQDTADSHLQLQRWINAQFCSFKVTGSYPQTRLSISRKAPERGPLYVLYYDMVNTPTPDQMAFRKQLLEFVDNAQSGARIALFVNAGGLHMIQGFTSDHALVRTAILSSGPGPHVPRVFIFGEVYGYEDSGAALSNLRFIAEYLRGIPGRKNLIWMSSEFPIPVGPSQKGSNSSMRINQVGPYLLDLSRCKGTPSRAPIRP